MQQRGSICMAHKGGQGCALSSSGVGGAGWQPCVKRGSAHAQLLHGIPRPTAVVQETSELPGSSYVSVICAASLLCLPHLCSCMAWPSPSVLCPAALQVKRLSPLFLFRDPCQLTRADLGPVEASCFCSISDNLQSNWQLLLEAAPAPCSPQSHGSSGTAFDHEDICNNSSGHACTSAATSCASSPASQLPSSAARAQPPTPTLPPQQPKVSFLSRAAARVKGAVGAVVSWCVSAVKTVASAACSWL